MAFWGIEIKPGKSYTHTYDREHGRLRISQATLGIGKSTNKSSLQCKVGNKCPILLCNLIPNVSETCSLELEFEEDEEVVFSVIGQTSVHLSGYYLGGTIDEDDSDSYGEDITAYDSSENSGSYDEEDEEDEYDAEFIDDGDDDMEMFPPSSRKSSVIIEEIEEDENPSNEKAEKKKKKKKKHQQGISDDANEKQLVVSNGNAVPESEDEDGFPVSSLTTKREQEETSKAEKSCEKSSEKTSVEYSKGEKENDVTEKTTTVGSDEKDRKKNKKKKKNKKATVAEVVVNESLEIAKDSKDIKEANDAKDTKEANAAMDQDQTKVTDPTPAEEASVKKKKKNKKKRAKEDKDSNEDGGKVVEVHESDAKKIKKEDTNTGKDITPNSEQGVDTKVSKSGLKTRTYANGLIIQEIAMGKPDGRRAIPGKKVSVNYVGKLLKTWDVFDSNVGKKPFRFRSALGKSSKDGMLA